MTTPDQRHRLSDSEFGPDSACIIERATNPSDVLGGESLKRSDVSFVLPLLAGDPDESFRQRQVLPVSRSHSLTTAREPAAFLNFDWCEGARSSSGGELSEHATVYSQFVFYYEVRHVVRQPRVVTRRRIHV